MAGLQRAAQHLRLGLIICASAVLLLVLFSRALRDRRQEERHKRDVLESTEIPAEHIDPAAIDLTPLVNTLINTSQSGSRQLFSLLSVTSYSSLALHKLTLLVYNISSIRSIESNKFRRRFCYCVTNETNDLTDFTAILLDVMGNSTSYLHELFKSASILSVSQRNNSDCIYICVMAGKMGREVSELWQVDSITPLFNQTIVEGPHRVGNISSIRLPVEWHQVPTNLSHISPSGMSSMLTSRVHSTAHVSPTAMEETAAAAAKIITAQPLDAARQSTTSMIQSQTTASRQETTVGTTQPGTTQRPTTTGPTTQRTTTTGPTTPRPTTPLLLTQRQTTKLLTTQRLTTKRPTTQRITTQRPTARLVTTQRPTTPRPTTQKPTTPLVITQRPTTQRPTTQQMTTQRPTARLVTTQRPTTQRPTTQQMTTQRPTARLVTTQRPTTQRPTMQQMTMQRPTARLVTTPRPTTQRPTARLVTTPRPTTERPTARLVTTPRPTTQRPTTQRITTQRPTARLVTTQRPTTPRPTTQRPTTQLMTAQRPATQRPTTRLMTTQRPATQRPATQRPTTQAVTTTSSITTAAAPSTTQRTAASTRPTTSSAVISPTWLTTDTHLPRTTTRHTSLSPVRPTAGPTLARRTTRPLDRKTTTLSKPTEKAGCPWRRPELTDVSASSSATTVSAHKLQPCVLELCKFFSQCLCRPFSHKTRMKRYCDDSHVWYQKHTFEVCRRVRRVSFSRNLKQRCLTKMCSKL